MFYRALIAELERWKKSTERKPLVIRGARQVGKTTLVHEFGKQFKQYIYLNLEQPKDALLFEKYETIHELVAVIFLEKRAQQTYLSDTLLFIDEIQEKPKVVNLLRYFKEEVPELAVIAAGSMLETLLGKNITFPVGRVEYRVLRPFSFEEYLIAVQDDMLLAEFRKTPIEKYALQALFSAFKTYALIGGMPEIIHNFSLYKDITALGSIYDSLLNSYLQDAEKYAKNEQQLQLIRFCIQQAVLKAGQRTSFQQFGQANYGSKAIGEVLRALEKTHLLSILYPTTGTSLPLEPDYKKTPRIQFLDTGLINFMAGLQKDILGTKDLSNIYQGRMIEHLVGQELLSFQSLSLSKLQFWVRQKNQSDAEVDFLFPYKGKLIPIEVKSGAQGHLKSLHIFIDNAPIHFGIRFYAGNLQLDKVKTNQGKTFYLLNLPYFLASRVREYADWLIDEIGAYQENENSLLKEDRVVYHRNKPQKPQPTPEQLGPIHLKILHLFVDGPKKGRFIFEDILGLTYQSRNKNTYLKPLLDLGLIDFTIKSFEKSKQQAYALTERGVNFLRAHDGSL